MKGKCTIQPVLALDVIIKDRRRKRKGSEMPRESRIETIQSVMPSMKMARSLIQPVYSERAGRTEDISPCGDPVEN